MTLCRIAPAAVALALLAGCGPDAATPAAPALAGPSVPSVVGLTLDKADDQLQAVGFGQAGATDAVGDRAPTIRSEWQVCTQEPGPGPTAAGTRTVGVTIVRTSEACPDTATASPTPTTAATPPSPLRAVPEVPSTRRPYVPAPAPKPAPAPAPAPAPEPAPAPAPAPAPPDDNPGTTGPTVHAGSFCSPEGAVGVTSKGKPMVCKPGRDGRDRWAGA